MIMTSEEVEKHVWSMLHTCPEEGPSQFFLDALNKLPPRQRIYLTLYRGFSGMDRTTPQKIGELSEPKASPEEVLSVIFRAKGTLLRECKRVAASGAKISLSAPMLDPV